MEREERRLKIYRFKINVVGVMFFAFFCIVIYRSYQLQILGNAKLNRLAKSQYKTNYTVSPRRGTIYDRNGNVLALDIQVASIGIHPHQIYNKEKVKKNLLNYINISEKDLERKFSSKKKFEWVKRRIKLKSGESIEKLRLKGVQVAREFRRYYPNKDLAGQLLGAVGYDAKALAGLEVSLDKYLKEGSIKKKVERDAKGRVISALYENEDSQDVYLTIDKTVQHFAEQALYKQAKKHKAANGFAIVSEVNTGEIVAMANYPKFNPNIYWRYDQKKWRNRAVADSYEPGSTFKSVLMVSALESGKVKLKDRFFCENGKFKIGNYYIKDDHPSGWLNVRDVMKVSSNIGATKIAYKTTKKIFYDYIQNMGFTKQVHGGLHNESTGYLQNYKRWREIEFSNVAFGQGLTVTGLQMIAAYGAIANGGDLYKPHLIKKITKGKSDVINEHQPELIRTVMSQKTAMNIREMLVRVVGEGGTAPMAVLSGYKAAGKTGTSQKFNEELKKYSKGDYISSFIGFVPVEKPKYLIYVVYDSPKKGSYYGGVVAGPAFKSIAENILKYAGIKPDVKEKVKLVQKVKDTKTKEVVVKIENVFKQRELSLKSGVVPDLRGMSMRKAFQIMDSAGLKYQIKGTGVVIKQVPKPGEVLRKNEKWLLELAKPS